MKTKEIVLCAIMAAVTAILAQLSVPLGAVPFTLSILSVYLTAGLLGGRLGAISMLIYLLLGAAGLPVFSGFSGGFPVLAGPRGGYLIGYVIAAFLVGTLLEKQSGTDGKIYVVFVLSSLMGMAVIYLAGVIQLKFVLNLTWGEAYWAGAAPFIVLDLIKILVVAPLAVPVRQALKTANLIC